MTSAYTEIVRRNLAFLSVLALTPVMLGADGEPSSNGFDWGSLWREVPWFGSLWQVAKWALLGAFLGFLLGLAVFFLLRRLKLYAYPGTAGKVIWGIVCIFYGHCLCIPGRELGLD